MYVNESVMRHLHDMPGSEVAGNMLRARHYATWAPTRRDDATANVFQRELVRRVESDNK